jgi:site-specific DNA-cytosine methylase
VFENVPRIATRGRHLLDQIVGLLRAYGYAVAETTHDCGELGGLAQSRKRFLLVARHMEKVPPFLYEPDKKPLRAVGDVLGKMPLPGAARRPDAPHPVAAVEDLGAPRVRRGRQRLAQLNKLAVEDGVLRDYLLVPCGHGRRGVLGVNRWERAERRRRGPQRAHERRLQRGRSAPAGRRESSSASTGCTPGKTAWAP